MHKVQQAEVVQDTFIPPISRTRSGREFCPQDNLWKYRDELVSINMDFLKFPVTHEVRQSIKKIILWYAENKSPSYMYNLFTYLLTFFRRTSEEFQSNVMSITPEMLLNYYATLSERNKYKLGYIAGPIKLWIKMELPGVRQDCLALLKQMRIKGCVKGEAVLTHDPEKGAFSDIEYQSLLLGLKTAYEKGDLARKDFLLGWLSLVLGMRPIQYAGIKLCDFHILEGENSEHEYLLYIPRAKQRHQLSRESFTKRPIEGSFVGKMLTEHVEDLQIYFRPFMQDPRQAPMFPMSRPSQEMAPGFEYHRTSGSMSWKIRQILSRLQVKSERTGKYINVTPLRARRSLGTRAATEGHGELVIAELLDHTDIQNAGIYVQAIPDMLERLDEALAFQLAPRAQAFAGMIIERDQAKASPHTITNPYDGVQPVGSCGKQGFCQSLAPIACYTCTNFQAWVDGPHASILKHLLKERKRLRRSADARIASVNDRTILAVADVVQKCRKIKEKRGIVGE